MQLSTGGEGLLADIKFDKDFFIHIFKLEGATPAGQFNLRGVVCLFIIAIVFGAAPTVVNCVSIIVLHKTCPTYGFWELVLPGLIAFGLCFAFLAWEEIRFLRINQVPAIYQIASTIEDNPTNGTMEEASCDMKEDTTTHTPELTPNA